MRWQKSSFSTSTANCVEVSDWRKSTRSTDVANCVEVRTLRKILDDAKADVAVRDSKNPNGPTLTFAAQAWKTFLSN